MTETTERSPKKRKARAAVVALVAVLLAVVATLEFVPASPCAGFIRELFAPAEVSPAHVAPSAEERFGKGAVRLADTAKSLTITVEYTLAEDEEDAGEVTEPPEGGEPSEADLAAAQYAEALSAALAALNARTLQGTAIELVLTSTTHADDDAITTNLSPTEYGTTLRLEPDTYEITLAHPIVDAMGFAWELAGGAHQVEFTEDAVITLALEPVDLAALSEEAYIRLSAQAGTFAPELAAMRTLALQTVAPEDDAPEAPSSPTSPRPGGTPSGSGGGGNSGGEGGSTQPAEHVHVWSRTEYVVTSPAHDEVVEHAPVYHYWTEYWEKCSTCGADISGNANEHLRLTGHSGWTTEAHYHQELITPAWDEIVHHEERGFYTHFCLVFGCNAFETWN